MGDNTMKYLPKDKKKRAIQLLEEGNFSPPEIAAMLGLKEAQVSKLKHRAGITGNTLGSDRALQFRQKQYGKYCGECVNGELLDKGEQCPYCGRNGN